MDEVKVLAAKMERIIYDDSFWIDGWAQPIYRVAYRPWIRWPKEFGTLQSRDFQEFWLMWVDKEAERDILAGNAEGRNLSVQILTYDKLKAL